MLLLLAALAAGSMSAPAFSNKSGIITPDDYPSQLLFSGESAFEDVRVVVAPSGKAERCDVVAELQDKAVNRTNKSIGPFTCSLIMRRAAFRPATSSNGQPTYGTIATWVRWQNPRDLPFKNPYQVDADISVVALPSGMSDPALIDLDVAVAADGAPGACAESPRSPKMRAHQVFSPELANVACAQIGASGKLSPAQTQSGEVVASVQRMVARFSSAKPAAATPTHAK